MFEVVERWKSPQKSNMEKNTDPVSKGIVPTENSILPTTIPIGVHNELKKSAKKETTPW